MEMCGTWPRWGEQLSRRSSNFKPSLDWHELLNWISSNQSDSQWKTLIHQLSKHPCDSHLLLVNDCGTFLQCTFWHFLFNYSHYDLQPYSRLWCWVLLRFYYYSFWSILIIISANWVFFGFRLVLRSFPGRFNYMRQTSDCLRRRGRVLFRIDLAWTIGQLQNKLFRNTSGMQKLSEAKLGNGIYGIEYGQVA